MFSFCHNFCWLLGESFINCENLTDYCYNTKIINLGESHKMGTPFCIVGIALRGYAPRPRGKPAVFFID